MTIKTKYNTGDIIHVNGYPYKIISVHVYQSAETHTERYYLGHGLWITLQK